MGKAAGPHSVAGAQLPQHCKERIAHQRVDLVDQQDKRPFALARPASQRDPERAVSAPLGEHRRPRPRKEVVSQRVAGLFGQLVENGADRRFHVFSGSHRALDVDVDATMAALGVQQVAEGEERGGLPGLPGRVEDEVVLGVDQLPDFGKVYPVEWRNAVVVPLHHGAGRVEEAHSPASVQRLIPRRVT